MKVPRRDDRLAWRPGSYRLRRSFATSAESLVERSVSRSMARSKAVAVGRIDHLGQAIGEVERDRRQILVHGAPRRRQSEERFPQVFAVGAPRHELAPLQERHRPRHLGLVHVAVGADRLARHHAVLAERHQHPPFRHADAVAVGVEARQRVRDEARHHVEPIRKKFLKLERRLIITPVERVGRAFIGRAIGHVSLRPPRARQQAPILPVLPGKESLAEVLPTRNHFRTPLSLRRGAGTCIICAASGAGAPR